MKAAAWSIFWFATVGGRAGGKMVTPGCRRNTWKIIFWRASLRKTMAKIFEAERIVPAWHAAEQKQRGRGEKQRRRGEENDKKRKKIKEKHTVH